MKNNLDKFMEEYAWQLDLAVRNFPEEYRYPIGMVPTVVARMRVGFTLGSFNKDSRAIKATCKKLGIPFTYKGIKAYIAQTTD